MQEFHLSHKQFCEHVVRMLEDDKRRYGDTQKDWAKLLNVTQHAILQALQGMDRKLLMRLYSLIDLTYEVEYRETFILRIP